MHAPDCPDHRSLMLELARGRLEGSDALAAEALRERCPACRAWYEELLATPGAAAVERAVGEAFAAFAPPRHRSRSPWLRLAAAAVLVLGVGLLLRWIATGEQGDRTAPPRGELIVAINGEGSAADALEWGGPGAVRAAAGAGQPSLVASAPRDGQLIFRAGSEPEDPSAWSQSDALFQGGFEDGTTELWTNSL